MSNESLSRDALIEKVADAIDQLWTSERCLAGACAECAAAVALETFAAAVADDLEARASEVRGLWAADRECPARNYPVSNYRWGTFHAFEAAAERVRGLLGKDGK